jgi:rare lipoprotein A
MRTSLLIFLLTLGTQAAEFGKASWYSVKTNGGTHTASGRKLRDNEMTAAHKTLPFGTVVKVTNLNNGKTVNLVITNRGPYIRGRIIDVTTGAADVLGFRKNGITKVKVEVVKNKN